MTIDVFWCIDDGEIGKWRNKVCQWSGKNTGTREEMIDAGMTITQVLPYFTLTYLVVLVVTDC